jgi:nucleoside-diphosphate-sugar epimerase
MTQFSPGQLSILRSLVKDTARAIDFTPYVNNQVLISGASGHFGIWLTLIFAHQSTIDKRIKLIIETSQYRYVTNLLNQIDFGHIEHLDVSQPNKFDVIFDMSLPNSRNIETVNNSQLQAFLQQFFKQKGRTHEGSTLVIPSSGAVYGSRANHDFPFAESEADLAINRTNYGEAKFCVERLSAEFENCSLPIFRIFSVFGPLMRRDSPLIGNSFFTQCAESNEIKLIGIGKAQRNMTFVTDIMRQMISLSMVNRISNYPLNLGSENNLSVMTFADLVAQQMSAKVILGKNHEPPDYYTPNLNRLNEIYSGSNTGIQDAIELTSYFHRSV